MIVSRILRSPFSKIKQQLRWREYGELLQFLVYQPNSTETVIYPVDQQLTFQQLKQRQLFKDYQFTLPKGFDPFTPIHSILTIQQKPCAIQVDCRGQKYFLLNRITESDQRCLLKALNNNGGLVKTAIAQSQMSQFRRFMNGFYSRLQAQAYLKRKGISHKQEMTKSLKQQVISFLANSNQVEEQSKIANYLQIEETVALKIVQTENKIQGILEKADKLLRIYKTGAVALSITHILGFGYMIFFVDWLGWDIIEPLTFSVGSLYSLLGLRFYRKFNKDRNEESIRHTLQEWVLNAPKRIELKELRRKLQQQRGELRDIQNKIKIAKYRLVLQSNLPVDF